MTDQAVVVTGATHGIGRSIALEFHRRGHVVYATGRVRSALAELDGAGLRTAALDVTDTDAVDAFVRRLDEDGVTLHVLVNNAGYGLMGPLVELPLAEARRQFEVNTIAPLGVTQTLLPALIAHGWPTSPACPGCSRPRSPDRTARASSLLTA
jgi:NAD(P)-dependent dehydrogenase (short-subunit alcohol dehydrogenase family)